MSVGQYSNAMKIIRPAIVTLTAVTLIGAIGAAALYWRLASAKSVADPDGVATENVWNSVLCRGQLYLQKAKGEVSDISWAELWGLTLPGRGFTCTEGSSLESSLQFSTDASDEDRKAGARIFHERCSVCHGLDGSGGPFAPSLTRSAIQPWRQRPRHLQSLARRRSWHRHAERGFNTCSSDCRSSLT